MEIDYSKAFKFETNHCKHLDLMWDSLLHPKICFEFGKALQENIGRKLIYVEHHTVCKLCNLPGPFYVQFCWVGQHFYFGLPIPESERCTECKGL